MALRETAAHLRPETKTESNAMPAMMFLISLLTPDVVEHYATDLFEPLFELYRVRLLSGNLKPQTYNRIHTHPDAYGTTSDRKVLHY